MAVPRHVMLLSLFAAGGCAASPPNPSFPIATADAERLLGEMEKDRKPLARPLVVLGGYLDPGLGSWWVARQLRRVLEYLDASLPDPVALNELAALSGLSPWHFSRAFKASTGLAPYRWQLDSRIRRAQSLLLDTRATLEQIAEATGFADAVHFGRTFRKLVGTTPGSWRQAHKN